jgi:hypothetical protein
VDTNVAATITAIVNRFMPSTRRPILTQSSQQFAGTAARSWRGNSRFESETIFCPNRWAAFRRHDGYLATPVAGARSFAGQLPGDFGFAADLAVSGQCNNRGRLMIGLRATEFAGNGTKHFWPLREIVLKQNPDSTGRRRIAGPNREPSAMIKLLPILTLLTCLTFASFAPALMAAFAN